VSDSLDAFWTLEGRTPDVPESIRRDRWGRPLIIGPDGVERAYTRMSTIAGKLDDKTGLETWKRRQAMRGVAIVPELAAMVASLPEKTGNRRKDELTSASWREYEGLAEEAARSHAKANWGTAFHGFTEPGMRGNPVVPEAIKADVDSYWERVDEYRVVLLASEVFVVNHELRIAGTFDDLYWIDGFGVVVGDKKSGKKKVKPTTIQMAGYANCEVYDPETGESRPLLSLVDWAMLGFDPANPPVPSVNKLWAFFVHAEHGTGVTTFYKADIDKGFKALRVAAWVRDFQSDNEGWVFDAHDEILRGQRQREAQEAMARATSVVDLSTIADSFADIWHDGLTAYGREVMASWGT